jgi:hypothetical protein
VSQVVVEANAWIILDIVVWKLRVVDVFSGLLVDCRHPLRCELIVCHVLWYFGWWGLVLVRLVDGWLALIWFAHIGKALADFLLILDNRRFIFSIRRNRLVLLLLPGCAWLQQRKFLDYLRNCQIVRQTFHDLIYRNICVPLTHLFLQRLQCKKLFAQFKYVSFWVSIFEVTACNDYQFWTSNQRLLEKLESNLIWACHPRI